MKEKFIERNFSDDSLDTIKNANRIIADYRAQGFTLTLRQLYYQFVQEGLRPNTLRSYKNLGATINDARLAGLVDWDAMEDRMRNREALPNWFTPGEFMRDAPYWFHVDMWDNQRIRPEVWIEKDALVGVITDVCQRHDVPYFACRGYTSQSEQYAAGKRFAAIIDAGQIPLVLHLGDHDPSGIDMTRDNADRLSMFAEEVVEVRRLALNFDQVEELSLPPNPTKSTDSRTDGYVERFGKECWELDALRPTFIAEMIEAEIEELKDPDPWDEKVAEKKAGQDHIRKTWRAGVAAGEKKG